MNKQQEKLSIKLEDKAGDQIFTVLWNANVTNFNGNVGDYIQIYDCIVDSYNGEFKLGTNSITTYDLLKTKS